MRSNASERLFSMPQVVAKASAEGCLLLRSAEPLGEYPSTVMQSLWSWAGADPGHPLAAERSPDGSWRICSYGAAIEAAEGIGQALLDDGLGPDRPLLILSGNSVDHMLMMLGALTAGIPVVPVSAAYSTQSRDHNRIRAIVDLVLPGAVFAGDARGFGAALDAIAFIPAIVSTDGRPGARQVRELAATKPGARLAAASAALAPGAAAKILFTSGSTGFPKGVINTHRMLSANQQMMSQAWPFLTAHRPVVVDWLPWSHTFGGNFIMNMIFTSGGTLYVDNGRPAPALFAATVTNLTEIPPTIYFNVPAGYAQLVPALESDPAFASRFFSRLQLMFNAGAALPAATRQRLGELALSTTGRAIPVTSAWGTTETAPAATAAHYEYADARCIGVPLPGCEVKLAPVEDSYEIRVRGPNISPGYFQRAELTAAAFDDEGYYRSGDAVALADPADPNTGLLFRGRIAEDFKLATGTFVRVGALRTALLSCAPVLLDAVITGEDRDRVGALAWLNLAQARRLLGREPQPSGELIVDGDVCKVLAEALAGHNNGVGSAARIERLLVMARPPDLDAGEITDKGYVNQRRVLSNRAHLIDLLYGDPQPDGVVVAHPQVRRA